MDIDAAWTRYVAAEEDRIRDVSMLLLEDVIRVARSLPEDDRVAWARQRAQDAVDRDSGTPTRLPTNGRKSGCFV